MTRLVNVTLLTAILGMLALVNLAYADSYPEAAWKSMVGRVVSLELDNGMELTGQVLNYEDGILVVAKGNGRVISLKTEEVHKMFLRDQGAVGPTSADEPPPASNEDRNISRHQGLGGAEAPKITDASESGLQPEGVPSRGLRVGTSFGIGFSVFGVAPGEARMELPQVDLPGLTLRRARKGNRYLEVDILVLNYLVTALAGQPTFIVPMRFLREMRLPSRWRALVGTGYSVGMGATVSSGAFFMTHRIGGAVGIEAVLGAHDKYRLGVLLEPQFELGFSLAQEDFLMTAGFRCTVAVRFSARTQL